LASHVLAAAALTARALLGLLLLALLRRWRARVRLLGARRGRARVDRSGGVWRGCICGRGRFRRWRNGFRWRRGRRRRHVASGDLKQCNQKKLDHVSPFARTALRAVYVRSFELP
jgi:hypothetical protein